MSDRRNFIKQTGILTAAGILAQRQPLVAGSMSTWYAYGYKEGIPRMSDNWDKLGIKVTSHMVGSAVLKIPLWQKK